MTVSKPERLYACYRDGKIVTQTICRRKKTAEVTRDYIPHLNAKDHPVIPVIITPEEPE